MVAIHSNDVIWNPAKVYIFSVKMSLLKWAKVNKKEARVGHFKNESLCFFLKMAKRGLLLFIFFLFTMHIQIWQKFEYKR